MNELTEEAIRKLIKQRPQYVRDAVIDTADRFEAMSDGGTDSLYAEPARRWRWLGSTLDTLWTDGGDPDDEFDDGDYEYIVAGLLWYELNCA